MTNRHRSAPPLTNEQPWPSAEETARKRTVDILLEVRHRLGDAFRSALEQCEFDREGLESRMSILFACLVDEIAFSDAVRSGEKDHVKFRVDRARQVAEMIEAEGIDGAIHAVGGLSERDDHHRFKQKQDSQSETQRGNGKQRGKQFDDFKRWAFEQWRTWDKSDRKKRGTRKEFASTLYLQWRGEESGIPKLSTIEAWMTEWNKGLVPEFADDSSR